MRTTISPAIAVPRAAKALGWRCRRKKKGGKWVVTPPRREPISHGSWKMLAVLAEAMRHRGVTPREVRFVGAIPSNGISGWQRSALAWLSDGGDHA